MLIAIGLLYLGLKNPNIEQDVHIRKLELQDLVRMFHQEAESHAQLKKTVPRSNMTPTAADILPNGADYVLIS